MSATIPVSRSRTRAALAVGATPNTGRCWTSWRSVDRGGEHRGLAGTGGTDDHHQPVVTGGRRGGVGLQHIEPVTAHRRRRCRFVGLGVDRPGEDRFFLGEDRFAGDVRGDGFDPHRPAIRDPPRGLLRRG